MTTQQGNSIWHKGRTVGRNLLILLALPFLQSCFTGVEGTSKINLTKKDYAAVAPKEEDLFIADVKYQPIGEWETGKQFIISDEKFLILTENPSDIKLSAGDTITFSHLTSRIGPDGNVKALIEFTDPQANKILYSIDKSLEEAAGSLTQQDIPFLIDTDILNQINSKLIGKHLWTKSTLWYDANLEYIKGRKFDEVVVSDVVPGNAFFPVIVRFRPVDGGEGQMLMNIGTSGNETRNFSRLFSLADPRQNYRHITDEMWRAIQNEEFRVGMTKEECRLSKGNPSDVDMGHDYSNSVEIWFYPNGSYARFVDGLLVNFK